jgi:hypothetical protein
MFKTYDTDKPSEAQIADTKFLCCTFIPLGILWAGVTVVAVIEAVTR